MAMMDAKKAEAEFDRKYRRFPDELRERTLLAEKAVLEKHLRECEKELREVRFRLQRSH